MADGRARTVPEKIDSIKQLEVMWFAIVTSPKHDGLLWSGALNTLGAASKSLEGGERRSEMEGRV